MRSGFIILMLQMSGVLIAPVILYNIVMSMLKKEGMYDRESSNIMFYANVIGIVLAVAWFCWSGAYLWRMLAALVS